MTTYLALLRGINVGGNALIKMADLKTALTAGEFNEVRTYIQSGNVIFESDETDKIKLAQKMQTIIEKAFKLKVDIVVFSKDEWQQIMAAAPKEWGTDPEYKHNLLIMIGEHDMKDVVAAYGEIKPGIEMMSPGKGVIYQSLSWTDFGKTTGGKIAGNPIYKKMTIRNFNTASKLVGLMRVNARN